MINRALMQKGAKFVVVGTLGFLTDAGLLWLTTHKAGLDPYSGRLVSFSMALLVTWVLNSTFTFKNREKSGKRQLGSYVTVQVSSFGLNYAIYSALVWLNWAAPLIALLIAAFISMFYSFTTMNMWVFKDAKK
ncbi:MAG: GtrA family protein [Thalassospira sp.]|uniref:GtrA family protein n=1 Tax=Thalassospira sp. TaxID=1912094 RepID=UPI0032EDB066